MLSDECRGEKQGKLLTLREGLYLLTDVRRLFPPCGVPELQARGLSRGHFTLSSMRRPLGNPSWFIASFLAFWQEKRETKIIFFKTCDICTSVGYYELVKTQSSWHLLRVHWRALVLWYRIHNKGALWSWHDLQLILRAQTGGVVMCLQHVCKH